MKKFFSLILSLALIFSFSACGKNSSSHMSDQPTADDANAYLTNFFASYTDMCAYISRTDSSLFSYTYHSASPSELLKPMYQEGLVSYSFTYPTSSSPDVFTSTVTVTSVNLASVSNLVNVDIALSSQIHDVAFIQNSFHENLVLLGDSEKATSTVDVTLRFTDGTWHLDTSNSLINAVFYNLASTAE